MLRIVYFVEKWNKQNPFWGVRKSPIRLHVFISLSQPFDTYTLSLGTCKELENKIIIQISVIVGYLFIYFRKS